ncbi:MAG: ATP-binding protein [Bifidobacteriaceae bacterium]|jgi:predicted AAA+ superfamily ATPase|nr:ATP-binding protein [Bifidobacteriaceae bacterium]
MSDGGVSGLVDRPQPLAWLRRWRDRELIKVVTGVRRCGKSTLLRMFRDELLLDGVAPRQIVALNLEDPAHAPLLADHSALYEYICRQLSQGERTYVFIDEIQRADQFERVIDGLFIKDSVDLYVTGSSSRLTSGSLATLLTGRYVALQLLPYSFAEFVGAQRLTGDQSRWPLLDLYSAYTSQGGFPYALAIGDENDADQYLRSIMDTVLLHDVVAVQGVREVAKLRRVTEFLFGNIGNLTSIKRISDTMTSLGSPVTRRTVESFVEALASAFLLYPARRWDVRGRRLLEGSEKHFVVDTGLRRALLGNRPVDTGHVLENTVYLELLRRPGRVYVGKIGTQEVDFVVEDQGVNTFIQVAASVAEPATLNRELAPLRAIPGYEPRLLLTLDREPNQSYDGIQRRSVINWLLDR